MDSTKRPKILNSSMLGKPVIPPTVSQFTHDAEVPVADLNTEVIHSKPIQKPPIPPAPQSPTSKPVKNISKNNSDFMEDLCIDIIDIDIPQNESSLPSKLPDNTPKDIAVSSSDKILSPSVNTADLKSNKLSINADSPLAKGLPGWSVEPPETPIRRKGMKS